MRCALTQLSNARNHDVLLRSSMTSPRPHKQISFKMQILSDVNRYELLICYILFGQGEGDVLANISTNLLLGNNVPYMIRHNSKCSRNTSKTFQPNYKVRRHYDARNISRLQTASWLYVSIH
ncbi:hypothetical protein GDO86_017400 [Hymenochirus boettgeri]|uniref:Uncharacterized protein n=1 Tax=Hymenochirus boettgeri TaxID=247094 RepID=A0A8T2IPU1_9PIPI|nr:hypothetical protein GDO86_017400 [Hymenochirus boettgeri]